MESQGSPVSSLDRLLTSLKGISESTRLRIVAVLLNGELTVSELTSVLDQSQPRVSRHLKLLAEAGIIERHQEGSWAFYRVADHPLVELLRRTVPRDDRRLAKDQERLDALHRAHRERAGQYFRRVAGQWDRIRGHGAAETRVEERLLNIVRERDFRRHVDLGTGTGRMLQLMAEQTRASIGIDNSREMLAVARVNLANERYVHCQARYGDILRADLEDGCSDLVTVHHVLHYLESPAQLVAEAARILEPGGLLVVVDLAPHQHERLRDESAHRRLGFEEDEVAAYMRDAGMRCTGTERVPASTNAEDALGVFIWVGMRPAEGSQAAVH